ncbi:potassium channel protein [Methylobacter sp. YRD-M1]|uniref:potassium channel protein n=1 Tax=Methylobacter sp. YRD-M1 TaxID=2911520 RepID=UPI00227D1DB9|nr:potassium channel protein [Methylobacter sp. YRD-M1]WAK01979.1 NAD-binding protein [Methylobacter sp. YRD-M1]
MLTRLIVYFAYSLKASAHYGHTKQFFYNLLENPHSRIKNYFDIFMIGVVVLSVLLLLYEAEKAPDATALIIEQAIVGLFIVEYLLRVWLYNDSHKIILDQYERAEYLNIPFRLGGAVRLILAKKIEYMLTPLALIDLLAILPSYRAVRLLRLFIIFRLFKLFRYFNSVQLFASVLTSKRFELYTLAVFLGFLIFIGSTGIYLFENPTDGGDIQNLFDAFYWSIVTLSTVGYGDITPQTPGGRLIAMALIFTGLGVISFFTSIIVSAFSDKMHVMRENRTYTELSRYDSFVIICGFGRVGQHIARQLEKDKLHFVVIDKQEANALKANELGYLAIHSDASENGVLEHAGINKKATAILCTTGDDVTNVYITLTSRHLNADIRIISRVNKPQNVKKFYQAGATSVIQPFEIAGMVAAEYVGQSVAFEAILGIIREEKPIVIETVPVHAGSFIENLKISEIDFAQKKLMLVGIISANPVHITHKSSYPIKNQCFYFNPAPHFEVQAGDLLVVIGRRYGIDYFRNQIERSRLKIGRRL